MSVLWFGGWPINFPAGPNTPPGWDTGAGRFRAFSQGGIVLGNSSGGTVWSNPFPGGAITSAWFSVVISPLNLQYTPCLRLFGLTLSSTSGAGVWIGRSNASQSQIALSAFDGTTRTELATESGASLIENQINRIIVNLQNFGATATVDVYWNNALKLHYSGSTAIAGVASLDSFAIQGNGSNIYSECLVTTTDQRLIAGVQTLALNGQGTTNNWTQNTYTNVNQPVFSDANPTYTNTTALDQQYTVNSPAPGALLTGVLAVGMMARLAKSGTPAVTQVKMGYKSGGSVAFGAGSTKAPGLAYQTFEQYDATNPVTGIAWTLADLTGLQLDLQSLT